MTNKEFAWEFYDNQPQNSKLGEIIKLYLAIYNKNKFNENMAKKVIRLSENELRGMIMESVKRILKENDNNAQSGKIDNIVNALKKLNFEQNGHEINVYTDDYPSEIIVTNINVPSVADCQEIARKFNVHFYTDNSWGVGVFEIE